MPKLIIEYGKNGPLKYLSHLELARAFQRAFRRANIGIKMSSGYSPRPKISHGQALSVGFGSSAEYMLVEAKEYIPAEELIKKISSVLPKGIAISRAKYIKDRQGSIMSLVQSLAYRIKVKLDGGDVHIEPFIAQLRDEGRLLVKHKEKQKWVETNKAILDWQVEYRSGDVYGFYMLLSTGNQNNIRPEVAVGKLSEMFPELGGVEILE
ncbi:MAG: TIGR03936 family radical SAM-associated protein, partial [Firmicutes bacterium]|nr:TIGR03936 family radical SAM-associated protein [Bacillota bacterium]